MNFKSFVTEKLEPSQFRNIVKTWKQSGISKVFDHVFGDKNRLYEPYEGKSFNEKESDAERVLRGYLEDLGVDYVISDYHLGLLRNKKTDREIKIVKFLDGEIERTKKDTFDHLRGKLNWSDKKIEDRRNDLISNIERIKKLFINDKTRAAKPSGKYLICYSRHAYDIAGMSTDRGWESCMTLSPPWRKKGKAGANAHYVPVEIKTGTIIAYLIREDDKNLQKPLGRMLIKPYYNELAGNDIMMVACTGGYGTVPDAMIKQVTEWTKKLNKNVKPGVYTITVPELTHVSNTTITKYPQTIEDCKKTWPVVEVFDNIEKLARNHEAWKNFVSSRWPTQVKSQRTFKLRETIRSRKVEVFDVGKMLEDFTMDKYVSLYKLGFDVADDVGYEFVKALKEMDIDNGDDHGNDSWKKIQDINDIRTIAYMINEHKYSTEPETNTETHYENWLYREKMLSNMNKKLYEPIKKYYTELKKNMRK